jgi:hypothetical protein
VALAGLSFRPEPFRITLTVIDQASGKILAARFHVKDAQGKPVQTEGRPFWRDHFVSPGPVTLTLDPGTYPYEVERGPEWSRAAGTIEAQGPGPARREIALTRVADLSKEGWWAGDLHIHRALEEAELHGEAEDLHILPVITWWNRRNLWAGQAPPPELVRRTSGGRFVFAMAGEDEREGGALLFFHLPRPLSIQGASREHPSPMTYLEEARATAGAHVDIEKPFWWDVPLWAASGKVDTIGLANNHMCRSRMYEDEAWGHPRDTQRLPAPRGNGFWSQEIYYHLLNSGLRLAPSAGSASGVLSNPVGYNRVYVQVGPDLTWDRWWEGLRAGRSFVTNGPLLRVTAEGRTPGSIFTAGAGEILKIALRATLTSNDPIASIEILRDGQVVREVSAAELGPGASLGSLEFRESGWFLVRCLAQYPATFRFASTAPFYVEIGDSKRRISRRSVRFFLDWMEERRGRIKETDPAKRQEVLRFHDEARALWSGLLEKANAE